MLQPFLTIITPTIGRSSLDRLIDSIENQSASNQTYHFLMWDAYRASEAKAPESYNALSRQSIVMPGNFGKNDNAPGSPLRAMALIGAVTPWVTFADDDVWWDRYHVEKILDTIQKSSTNWLSTFRHVWQDENQYIGVDRFESVGDDATRSVPYEMCDGNCMVFKREYGVLAAPHYRTTTDYNDDRIMYDILKNNAGIRAKTNAVTIHQICPEKLIDFFKENCSSL